MKQVYSEWNILSKRILGFLKVIEFSYNSFNKNPDGNSTANQRIINNGKSIFESLTTFQENYENTLPKNVNDEIRCFLEQEGSYFKGEDLSATLKNERVAMFAIIFSLLESKISYYMKNNQVYIHKAVEIAFSHLQRMLEVDKEMQEKWSSAKGEINFEMFGALHLLSHKIYAFKADSKTQKTDLIFQSLDERTKHEEEIQRLKDSVEGLVLTEWKVVNSQNELENQINIAKNQASIYSTESLSSLELASCRYLIMVSEKHLVIPKRFQEFTENAILYRVVNIVYRPNSPSKRAKNGSKTKKKKT